jgi:uncharacterized protein DUF6714/cysteine-rich CPCC protein
MQVDDGRSESARQACLCCGHRTLIGQPPGTWLTCPVCYWTDIALDSTFHENQLLEAQWNYLQCGASLPSYVEKVRAARPEEVRAVEWRPLEGVIDTKSPRAKEQDRLEAAIRGAFSDVSGKGRTKLRDAYRADYDLEARFDWLDDESSWQRIPAEVLEFFGNATGVFNFGNIEAFRYYLPAYMIHQLRGGNPSAIRALDLKPPKDLGPQALDEVKILDEAQRAVVVRFLRFLLDHEGPDERIERALDRVWRHVT